MSTPNIILFPRPAAMSVSTKSDFGGFTRTVTQGTRYGYKFSHKGGTCAYMQLDPDTVSREYYSHPSTVYALPLDAPPEIVDEPTEFTRWFNAQLAGKHRIERPRGPGQQRGDAIRRALMKMGVLSEKKKASRSTV